MQAKTEIHPFGDFIPANPRYLILGSFPAREGGDWFYGSKRSQFWPILEEVYGCELKDKKDKQSLFSKLGIAVSDIIYRCERRNGSSLDINLVNVVYNRDGVQKILAKNKIRKIFFTSRFVETKFRSQFKNITGELDGIEFVTLPSPSPRYATLSKEEKISRYRAILPKIRQPSKS